MILRDYAPGDASATWTVFERAVHETAAVDYDAEQRSAWAQPSADLTGWNRKLLANRTVVAVEEDAVVGFSDADEHGYVDMMFVSPDAGGRGVGAALLRHVLARAADEGATEATTYASLTARGFFERMGFALVEQRRPVVRGVELTNFSMRKPLAAVDDPTPP